jgi:hypothetical protein
MVQVGVDTENGHNKPNRILIWLILGGWFVLELAVISFVLTELARIA